MNCREVFPVLVGALAIFVLVLIGLATLILLLGIMVESTTRTVTGAAAGVGFDPSFDGVRATLLETFADHDSVSVQASIWIVGKAILDTAPGDVQPVQEY